MVTSHQGPDDLQSALEGCAAVVIPAGVPRKRGTQALKQFSIEHHKTNSKVVTDVLLVRLQGSCFIAKVAQFLLC